MSGIKRRGYCDLNRNFGKRLKEVREILSLTQEDVARRVGYSRTNIAQLESGRARHVTLVDVHNFATALGLNPLKLVVDVFAMSSPPNKPSGGGL